MQCPVINELSVGVAILAHLLAVCLEVATAAEGDV